VSNRPTDAVECADRIIELVRSTRIPSLHGDSATQTMHAAYVQGFRRFVAIRDLASTGAGAEAMILSRSLLSMVARAQYIDGSEEAGERQRRYWQHRRRDLGDRIAALREFEELGLDVQGLIEEHKAELERIRWVGNLPTDRALMRKIGLFTFYAHFYRLASGYAHFAQWTALIGEDEVSPEAGDAEAAEEALALSIFTFGVLLAVSEDAVGHRLYDPSQEIVAKYFGSAEDT
jgi:hypothetical protein